MSAGHGLNFVELVVGPEAETICSALLVASLVCLIGIAGSKKLRSRESRLIPDHTLTLRNFLELIAEFILQLGDNVMGKQNRKFLPFLATLFFYIACLNLFGLVPGFSMPTSKVIFNAGIAVTVFVLYTAWGIREVGFLNYLSHLWGPIKPQLIKPWYFGVFVMAGGLVMGALIFSIECISHIFRPVTLSLRLFGNMTGDHTVLQVFTELVPFGVPVIFYFFGTFVCLLQAFVFTILTMVYIRFAVTHEEEHDDR